MITFHTIKKTRQFGSSICNLLTVADLRFDPELGRAWVAEPRQLDGRYICHSMWYEG